MDTLSPKSSLKWIPGMSESKKARSRKGPEEQEQLTVVTLSDEILDESGSVEGSANGSNRGPALPKQSLRPVASGAVHRGCWVSFEDVSYTVKTRKFGVLTLLKKVDGYFKPGEITAMMGSSGSGKTTLLDVISGRKTTGTITGKVLYNFELPTRKFLRQHTGYVEQFDTLVENLTVREMLMYTAEMKLPVSTGLVEKRGRVDQLVSFLSLTSCQNTVIGSTTKRGISGGQAKRVNIGVSLITDPQVLFLDEPTSGLDSFTADEVMQYVAKFARSYQRAVCATIHSPTPRTFAVFDRLMLLVCGHVVYVGPCGLPAVNYFLDNRLGVRQYEGGKDTEAEWLVELVTGASSSPDRTQQLSDTFRNSSLHQEVLKTIASESGAARPPRQRAHRHTSSVDFREDITSPVMPASVPMTYALRTMFMYRTLRNYQNGLFMSARLVDKLIMPSIMVTLTVHKQYKQYCSLHIRPKKQHLIMLSIMVTLFVHKGRQEDLQGAQMTAAALFMWIAAPNFGAAAYLPTIMLERPLYYRELNDGMYTARTYLIHKWVEEVLVAFPSSLVFNGILWWSLSLQGAFGTMWLAWFVTQLTAIALAFVFATVSPTLDFANGAVPSYGATLLFFTGYLIHFNYIPPWWVWYSYITYLRYPYSAMIRNQFDFRGRDANFDVCGTNQSIVGWFGMENEPPPWANILILCLWLATFTALGYVSLRYIRYNAR